MVKLGPVTGQAPQAVVTEKSLDKVLRVKEEENAPPGDRITLSGEAKKRLLMGQIMAALSSHEAPKKG